MGVDLLIMRGRYNNIINEMKYFYSGINQVCRQILRPARAEYHYYDLGRRSWGFEVPISRQARCTTRGRIWT